MDSNQKEIFIKKHLGVNTSAWIIKKCIIMIDDFEDILTTKEESRQVKNTVSVNEDYLKELQKKANHQRIY